ncbi:MAG: fimbrial biogenesis outer membrane usher protein [Rhizobacter sp.]|nr:fimbrial biogenesis outer membrane usher protein [Bacteriovorax sp.]
MRRINLKPLLFSGLLSLGLPVKARAQQNTDELFKKVFGKSSREEKKTQVDATLGDFFIGEINVSLMGEKIISISQDDLKRILSDKIREESLIKYKLGSGNVNPDALPFKIAYHASELRISVLIPPADLKPNDANVYDDLIPYYSRQAIGPAPFSLGLNYKLEQSFNKNTNQDNSFLAQTDAFMNIKNVSIENQMAYLSNRDRNWGRQSTKATFDRPNRMQRFEAGDVFFPIIGYQQAQSLGGVSFYKDFSLNPYRMVTPTSSFEYQIDNRSLVKTFVNNVLLKTEYMNAGRYSVRDIPLNNGINKIIVEITDEFGVTKVLNFNDSGSLDLLAEGISRYSLAAGYPSNEVDGDLKYNTNEQGAFASGFYQHGIYKHWTLGAYAQGNKNYSLLGTNNIFSSKYGNWSYDLAGEKNDFHSGAVTQLTYQLNLFGAYWYDSHTLTTRLEYRTSYFNEAGANYQNRYDYSATASYSVPLFERFNVAIGGSYQHPTIGDTARLAYNGSLTTNLLESSSITAYAGRSRDEFNTWSTQVYFFFNVTFGSSNTFASAFYDKESDTKRLTVIRDTGKKYNDVKIAAAVDDNKISKSGYADFQYNSVLADIGAREEVVKNKGQNEGYRSSVRFLSSFAYVNNGQDSAFSISRPISNSFVIFKPNEDWKGQKFGVQTSNGVNDASTGVFGETLVSELTPYQYRRLQLDPSNLEPGYILGQESFVVYPRKKSGHLFVIGKSGLLVLKGTLIDSANKPIALKVGYWSSATGKSTPFFTDREGNFFIEGVEASKGSIQIDDTFKPAQFDLSNRKHGMLDIGNIKLQSEESEQ